mgnify:FL=1|tara:strand:- start:55 stop:645 length:591 start_codon:yes stop_codon:yes gene_type:complete
MKDFIGIYPNSISNKLCDELKSVADKSHFVRPEQSVAAAHRQDLQIALEPILPGLAEEFMKHVGNCLREYIDVECPFLQQNTFVSSVTLVQKTEPTQGYHSFHNENCTWDLYCRSMAWMVYLNDVEEGGETEFLYQKLKVKPKKGTTLIWPGGYTHMHRGNPPMEDKFIATGWWQLDMGSINTHILRQASGNPQER